MKMKLKLNQEELHGEYPVMRFFIKYHYERGMTPYDLMKVGNDFDNEWNDVENSWVKHQLKTYGKELIDNQRTHEYWSHRSISWSNE